MILLKYRLCLLLAVFIFGLTNFGHAAESAIEFRIDSQSVSAALLQFAQQANISVLFPSQSFQGIEANPLNGRYSIEVGLELLLSGTGVAASISDDSSQIVIQPANAEQGNVATLADNPELQSGNTLFGVISDFFNPQEQEPETDITDGAATRAPPALREIVVNAQRREEALLETPVTVSVISGDDLEDENVRDLQGLSTLVPGMELEPDGQRTTIRIRGLGTSDGSPAAENIAALYLDGVYLSHRSNLEGYFFDLEQVEVVLGPQGTLYGRNTAAGTLNIRTNRPIHDEAAAIEVDFGNYDQRRFFGMANFQLHEDLAVRAAVQKQTREGYFSSNIDERDNLSSRLSLLWEPNERLSLFSKLEYSDSWQRGSGLAYLGTVNNSDPDNWIVTANNSDHWFDDSIFHPPGSPVDEIAQSSLENGKLNFMTELTYTFSDKLSTVINIARLEEDVYYGLVNTDGEINGASGKGVQGGLPGDQVTGTPWLEQVAEFRLMGNVAQQLDWTVGYFYWEDDTNEPATDPNGIAYNARVSLAESNSIYGQLSWTPPAHDQLHFTLGGRHTSDWKQWNLEVNDQNLVTVGGSGGLQSREWDNNDYKLGFAYDLPNDSLFYASYSTGYRAGSWFPGVFSNYDPEYLKAYELGWKGRLFRDTLELNANAFAYELIDAAVQFNAINTLSNENELSLANLGDAGIDGFNLNGLMILTRNDQLSFNIDYTDSEYTDFDFSSYLPLVPTFYSVDTFDWTGLELANTTKSRVTLVWVRDFYTRLGNISSRLQGVWNSSSFKSYRSDGSSQYRFPGYEMPSYSLLNWNLSFQPVAANWKLGLYVNNLLDEKVFNSVGGGATSPDVGGTVGPTDVPNGDDAFLVGTLRAPRTFGLRFRYDF